VLLKLLETNRDPRTQVTSIALQGLGTGCGFGGGVESARGGQLLRVLLRLLETNRERRTQVMSIASDGRWLLRARSQAYCYRNLRHESACEGENADPAPSRVPSELCFPVGTGCCGQQGGLF
jgi:hypothetical protein